MLKGGDMTSKSSGTGFGLRLATALLGAATLTLGIIPLGVLIWSVITGISVVTADWSNANTWFFVAIKGTLILVSYWLFTLAMKCGTALLRQANADEYEHEYKKLMSAISATDINRVQSILEGGAIPIGKRSPKHIKSALDLANSEHLLATNQQKIHDLEVIIEILSRPVGRT